MEVHHHSSPAPGGTHTPRKKWTHYLWEFLMLFLAVFCGFLAENFREHRVENNRAREYAKALYDDIVSDASYLNRIIRGTKIQLGYADTLQDLLRKKYDGKVKVPGGILYYYADESKNGTFFSIKTSALNQLKNSGSLRLLKNPELIRHFTNYDQGIYDQLRRYDADIETRNNMFRYMQQIFSYSETEKLQQLLEHYPASKDSILNVDFPLLTSDKKSFSDLSYALESRRTLFKTRLESSYIAPLETGIKLLEALKKEYHFE